MCINAKIHKRADIALLYVWLCIRKICVVLSVCLCNVYYNNPDVTPDNAEKPLHCGLGKDYIYVDTGSTHYPASATCPLMHLFHIIPTNLSFCHSRSFLLCVCVFVGFYFSLKILRHICPLYFVNEKKRMPLQYGAVLEGTLDLLTI